MSDARWHEAGNDVRSAVRHFSMAIKLREKRGDCSKDDFEECQVSMALMHAMHAGHTSFEKAKMRILDMLQEGKPTGESWHTDPTCRVSHALQDRPAILDPDLGKAADETRAFRNIANRGYDTFSLERCTPAISAARVLMRGLPEATSGFRRLVDPPESGGSGDGPEGGMNGGPS